MKKVFVTGADGFIGKNLIKELDHEAIPCIAGSRKLYGDLTTQNNWAEILKDCDVVVHLAARVHVMKEKESEPIKAFRKVNVDGTVNLAIAAKAAGVKRFIFLSTIKVNGEKTKEIPFSADQKPETQEPYGISKHEAEIALLKLHEAGVFDVVIIRPPLVYGPGVKSNFEKLLWLVKKDLPIPFGLVSDNKRSMVSVFNVVSLITLCLEHPRASGEVFLVSDDHDYSLKELIELMAKISGKHPHLLPIPVSVMMFGAKCLGKTEYANRLFGNLHVDIQKTKDLLNWKPPFSFIETFKNQN